MPAQAKALPEARPGRAPPPAPTEEAWPNWHLDLRLLTFRNVR